MIDLNKKADEIYQQNKEVGWWDDPNRCIFTTLQLVSTEIAEATEGERKDLMDDHLPNRKTGEVELADALIRVLDIGGRMALSYDELNTGLRYGHGTVGRAHLSLNHSLIYFSDRLFDYGNEKLGHWGVPLSEHSKVSLAYSDLICGILLVSKAFGYDVLSAMDEKLAYNKTRADHKRENRRKKGGKAF